MGGFSPDLGRKVDGGEWVKYFGRTGFMCNAGMVERDIR